MIRKEGGDSLAHRNLPGRFAVDQWLDRCDFAGGMQSAVRTVLPLATFDSGGGGCGTGKFVPAAAAASVLGTAGLPGHHSGGNCAAGISLAGGQSLSAAGAVVCADELGAGWVCVCGLHAGVWLGGDQQSGLLLPSFSTGVRWGIPWNLCTVVGAAGAAGRYQGIFSSEPVRQ